MSLPIDRKEGVLCHFASMCALVLCSFLRVIAFQRTKDSHIESLIDVGGVRGITNHFDLMLPTMFEESTGDMRSMTIDVESPGSTTCK